MLNVLWLVLILGAVLLGGFGGKLDAVTAAAFEACKTAVVTIALPLAGYMAMWLGIMRLAEKAGLIAVLAGWLRPVLVRLFPDVPPDHPAMGSMLMNMAANMLGLGNSATPLGLRAMQDLETLNRRPGTATNAMCMFLAINTSSIQLIPATVIGILSAAGSLRPTAVVGTGFVATLLTTASAIFMVKVLERLPMFALPSQSSDGTAENPPSAPGERSASPDPTSSAEHGRLALWQTVALAALGLAFAFFAWQRLGQSTDPFPIALVDAISFLSIPAVLTFFPLYAIFRGVKVYEEFVEGAKEGVQVAIRIVPYLVAILVAVGMFRASGGIEILTRQLAGVFAFLHFPPELLPLALIRPLSGSGATGIFTEIVQAHGPDSLISRMAGTFMGSSETTFYVLAVYFGSVAVTRTRHALAAGLFADVVGVIAAVAICNLVFG